MPLLGEVVILGNSSSVNARPFWVSRGDIFSDNFLGDLLGGFLERIFLCY